MANTMQLEILTPEHQYYQGDVSSLTVKTYDGYITVLPHHVDYLGNVEISKLSLIANNKHYVYAISGGTIDISQSENLIRLFVYAIESPDEIDLERAIRAKENASKLLSQASSKRDSIRAEIKLKRALNRIDVQSSH